MAVPALVASACGAAVGWLAIHPAQLSQRLGGSEAAASPADVLRLADSSGIAGGALPEPRDDGLHEVALAVLARRADGPAWRSL